MASTAEGTGTVSAGRSLRSAKQSVARRFAGDRAQAVLFLLPLVAVLAVFLAWPVVDAFRLSLTRWNGFDQPEYIGFENYRTLVDDPIFRQAVKNNLLALLVVPFWVLGPYLLACLIVDRRARGGRFLRIAYFLPAVLPPAALGILFTLLLEYDGPVNTFLRKVAPDVLARQWLVDTKTAFPTVLAIVVFATFGIGVVVFLGALASTDPELDEAARLDGTGWLQHQRDVTLPQIRGTMEFWAVMTLIGCFTALFPYVFTLTRGGPGTSTMVIDFVVYNASTGQQRYGYATAAGVVALLMVSIPVILALTIIRRRSDA